MSKLYTDGEKLLEPEFAGDINAKVQMPQSKLQTATLSYMGTVAALKEAGLWQKQ